MTEVLKLPAYRRLLVAYGLTQIAWSIVSVALALLVYSRTGSALGAALFFICAQFIPAFLAPPAVARLDRRASGRVLTTLYLLETGLFLLLAWAVDHLGVGFVLALALADGVIALVVRSLAKAATIAITSPVGLLREGNALANSVFSGCLMVGPALGGVIVGVADVRGALLVGSGMIGVISIMLLTARALPAAATDDSPAKGRLARALSYARRDHAVRNLLALRAIGLIFFTMSIPIEVVLAEHTLHAGAGGYGALLAAWGFGAIVGSIVFARWRRQSLWILIGIGAACLGTGFVCMAVSPTIVVAAVGSAIAGAGNGIESVAGFVALQEQVKPQWAALMTSLNESLGQGLPGMGILLGGAAAEVNGPRFALVVAGVGSLVVAVGVCLFLRPGTSEPAFGKPDAAPVEPLTFAGGQDRGTPGEGPVLPASASRASGLASPPSAS